MMDRLNVRNILRRGKYKLEGNDYSCPLCARNREETTFHLFFTCPFSSECWRHLGFNWNFNLDFHNMMIEAKQQCPHPFFMETFMVAAWLIWKQRNDLIFNLRNLSFQQWKFGFIEEAHLQAQRMQTPKKILFHSVLNLYR
jgi:hypothetical protein